jgi:hypothetical protein
MEHKQGNLPKRGGKKGATLTVVKKNKNKKTKKTVPKGWCSNLCLLLRQS